LNVANVKNIKGFLDAFEITDGVAIVTKNIDSLLKARNALTVEYSNGVNPNLNTKYIEETLMNAAEKEGIIARQLGKAKEMISSADNKITSTYLLPYIAHVNMEPMNCTVEIKDNRVNIWVPTQAQTSVLEAAKK